MKKVLITGSSGLVGSACVELFKERGWKVIAVDADMRSKFYNLPPQKEAPYPIDIRDEEDINELIRHQRPDAIIHAAAQPSHDWAKKDPLTDFDINARGTLVLLEAVRKYCPDSTFVYVSTDKVYGEHMQARLGEQKTRYHSGTPFNESLPLDETSRSLFGCSKLAGDLYVQEYGRYFGMKTACFRPGCITGKNHRGSEWHGFLSYLAKCIKEGKTYRIFGFKGKQVRDQIHAWDLANAFWHFIQEPKVAAVYNIGGGPDRSVSVLEAIKLIEEKTGKTAKTEYVTDNRVSDRIWDVHDVSKFKNDYPAWDYEYSLDDIITDLCA